MSESDNLAEEFFGGAVESDPQEYTQELIHAIEVRGKGWMDIKMGSLEIAFGDHEGEIEWEAELVTGGTWGGLLSEITGFKSLG